MNAQHAWASWAYLRARARARSYHNARASTHRHLRNPVCMHAAHKAVVLAWGTYMDLQPSLEPASFQAVPMPAELAVKAMKDARQRNQGPLLRGRMTACAHRRPGRAARLARLARTSGRRRRRVGVAAEERGDPRRVLAVRARAVGGARIADRHAAVAKVGAAEKQDGVWRVRKACLLYTSRRG